MEKLGWSIGIMAELLQVNSLPFGGKKPQDTLPAPLKMSGNLGDDGGGPDPRKP